MAHSIPLIGKHIKRFDQDVGMHGIHEAVRRRIRQLNIPLTISFPNKLTRVVLQNQPTIVVCNHPYISEVFMLISALPTRQDTFIVSNASFTRFGPSVSKHLIPVYIRHDTRKDRLTVSDRIFDALFPMPDMTPQEEHEKNINSIAQASTIVSSGGLVVMFPGGWGKETRWFPGIGHLIKQTSNPHSIHFVQAYVSGVTKFDMIRFVPGVRAFFPSVNVMFSEPKRISVVDPLTTHAKQITETLEQDYWQWVHHLPA